ncbi:DUF4864 domain-containing protein [Chthonobacter albigriseus]|uniref:DUF4864 domain-containing protein n=1 Tax=Chthonobacter albigriseus TaxID=1683161 RepID=UPI0015EE586A|nr:DUF4864 domain-containing protein [Chthonobacter albigriseus]
MKRLAGWLIGFTLLVTPASAEDAGAAIRSVIDGQLKALSAGDGQTAYGFASPGIQRIFPSPDIFMSMVKSGYAPVYGAKSVAFGRLKENGAGYLQEVFLVDQDGEEWTALYALEQQPDGSWRISGCQLLKQARVSA